MTSSVHINADELLRLIENEYGTDIESPAQHIADIYAAVENLAEMVDLSTITIAELVTDLARKRYET